MTMIKTKWIFIALILASLALPSCAKEQKALLVIDDFQPPVVIILGPIITTNSGDDIFTNDPDITLEGTCPSNTTVVQVSVNDGEFVPFDNILWGLFECLLSGIWSFKVLAAVAALDPVFPFPPLFPQLAFFPIPDLEYKFTFRNVDSRGRVSEEDVIFATVILDPPDAPLITEVDSPPTIDFVPPVPLPTYPTPVVITVEDGFDVVPGPGSSYIRLTGTCSQGPPISKESNIILINGSPIGVVNNCLDPFNPRWEFLGVLFEGNNDFEVTAENLVNKNSTLLGPPDKIRIHLQFKPPPTIFVDYCDSVICSPPSAIFDPLTNTYLFNHDNLFFFVVGECSLTNINPTRATKIYVTDNSGVETLVGDHTTCIAGVPSNFWVFPSVFLIIADNAKVPFKFRITNDDESFSEEQEITLVYDLTAPTDPLPILIKAFDITDPFDPILVKSAVASKTLVTGAEPLEIVVEGACSEDTVLIETKRSGDPTFSSTQVTEQCMQSRFWKAGYTGWPAPPDLLKDICVRGSDVLGNQTGENCVSIKIDRTPPPAPSINYVDLGTQSINPGPGPWTSADPNYWLEGTCDISDTVDIFLRTEFVDCNLDSFVEDFLPLPVLQCPWSFPPNPPDGFFTFFRTGDTTFKVKAIDEAGNESTLNQVKITYDNTPPNPVGFKFTSASLDLTAANEFSASWTSTTDLCPDSGIASWEYAIGTFPGGTDVTDWTSATCCSLSTTASSISPIENYYISVKAINGAGLETIIRAEGINAFSVLFWPNTGIDSRFITNIDGSTSIKTIDSANTLDPTGINVVTAKTSPDGKYLVYLTGDSTGYKLKSYNIITQDDEILKDLGLSPTLNGKVDLFKINPESTQVVFLNTNNVFNFGGKLISCPIEGPSSSCIDIATGLGTDGDGEVFKIDQDPSIDEDDRRVVYIDDNKKEGDDNTSLSGFFFNPIPLISRKLKDGSDGKNLSCSSLLCAIFSSTSVIDDTRGDIDSFYISPVGGNVAYLNSNNSAFSRINVIKIDQNGNAPLAVKTLPQVVDSTVDTNPVRMSANGRWIVFVAQDTAVDTLYSYNFDSQVDFIIAELLTSSVQFSPFKITPHAVNPRVIFFGNPEDPASPDPLALLSYRIDGSQFVEITTYPDFGFSVPPIQKADVELFKISHFGNRIVFLKDPSDKTGDNRNNLELYSVPFTGGTPVLLESGIDGRGTAEIFHITPNDTNVVYLNDNFTNDTFSAKIFTQSITGTNLRELTDSSSRLNIDGGSIISNMMLINRDSRKLVFIRRVPSTTTTGADAHIFSANIFGTIETNQLTSSGVANAPANDFMTLMGLDSAPPPPQTTPLRIPPPYVWVTRFLNTATGTRVKKFFFHEPPGSH